MKLKLITVGHKMPGWVDTAFKEFHKRLGGSLPVELIEIAPIPRNKNSNALTVMQQEAKLISNHSHSCDAVIALERTGKLLSTRDLANKIEHWQQEFKSTALVIGGADGLDSTFLGECHDKWSLSPLTFPHGLARVIVIEQLYRASSLLQGHPYHK